MKCICNNTVRKISGKHGCGRKIAKIKTIDVLEYIGRLEQRRIPKFVTEWDKMEEDRR